MITFRADYSASLKLPKNSTCSTRSLDKSLLLYAVRYTISERDVCVDAMNPSGARRKVSIG